MASSSAPRWNRLAGAYQCLDAVGTCPVSRPFGGDGESIGGRRSSSGIRCPAASYAVVSARFKEPREPFVSSADERRPPRVFFSKTLLVFCKTPNVVNVASLTVAAARRRLGRPSSPERTNVKNTLGGGSLGSCVDEERSQLR